MRAASIACAACVACGFSPATVEMTADAPPNAADALASDGDTVDGDTVDGGFTVAMCPKSYSVAIAATPQSRYRVNLDLQNVSLHRDACNGDAPGLTHLVVLDDAVEAEQINDASGTSNYFVGAIQAPDQATPTDGWFAVTGGALATTTWQGGQPNDVADVENNEQNAAASDTTSGLLNDIPTAANYRAICECDGKPIDPTVDALFPFS